ncbi:DUF6807 family protein [Pseudactinotalea suaedae]|uniref:DUF6807 family protein n=1 Tax=Pseudactinotalea suaedae TaxID=1524924 RepID=UPI0012E2ECD7|nr:DUF6807 family protein [Pseudactinotalea suaedae]
MHKQTGLTWQQDADGSLRLHGGAGELATFATGRGIAAADTPKPHVHPLRTPAGVVVTGFGPEDHPWHHGLEFAMPRVDDHNLWGGGTYLSPEQGYQPVDNHGVITHLGWSQPDAGERAGVSEELRWDGMNGEPLLSESRSWQVALTDDPALVIDLDTTLRSATGAAVSLQTPAQNGRPDGGYGGLFLRLQEGFTLVGVIGEEGTDVSESGGRSDTMVVHGRMADGAPVTIGTAFRDGPTPGTRSWLHRFEPFAAICWAVAYDEGLTVPVDGELRFQHRLALLDGHHRPDAVRRLLNEGAPSSP